jgi:hypothetical protein
VQYFTEPKSILAAYFVTQQDIVESQLNSYLQSKLPDYMLPQAYIRLDKLPLTVNGKLDRKALPIPEFKGEEYVAPRNELEQSVAHIWQELLKVERVGIQDDFFKLGGHSILAIQLAHQLKESLELNYAVADIFTYRNIESLLAAPQLDKSPTTFLRLFNEISYENHNLYFIHPAYAHSSESYACFFPYSMDTINLFGFEHYYLLEKNPSILSMHELASFYVHQMTLPEDKNKAIFLVGWSFGGNVGMEMAFILEQMGYMNVRICLIDAHEKANSFTKPSNKKLDKEKREMRKNLIKRGLASHEIEKRLNLIPLIHTIQVNHVSQPLKYTRVLLFKAMIFENEAKGLSTSLDNNWQPLVTHVTQHPSKFEVH